MPVIARVFVSPYQRELVRLLGLAYGQDSDAERALARTLADGESTPLPDSAHEIYEFVARRMVGRLTNDLGAQVTLALLADLATLRDVARHTPTFRPPSSQTMPRASDTSIEPAPESASRGSMLPPEALLTAHARQGVLLVEGDPTRRIAIARAFIRTRRDVTSVRSAEEAEAALDEGPYQLAVADVSTATGLAAFHVFGERAPSMPVLACADDADEAQRTLSNARVDRYIVCRRDSPADDLVAIAQTGLVPSDGH